MDTEILASSPGWLPHPVHVSWFPAAADNPQTRNWTCHRNIRAKVQTEEIFLLSCMVQTLHGRLALDFI